MCMTAFTGCHGGGEREEGKEEGELGEKFGSKEEDMCVVSQPTCSCNMYDVCMYKYMYKYIYTTWILSTNDCS